MRKVSLVIAALALVLGITQCKKQENSVMNGEKQHIVLNASFGDSNAKIDQEGAGLKWTVGDIINVMQGTEKLGELECKNIDGTFEGTITTPTGDITFTFGERKIFDQSGELNGAIYLESGESPANAEGEYDVWMNIPYAVLKLDLSAFVGTTKGATPLTISVGGTPVASVANVTNPSAVYVALEPTNEPKEYTITCNGKQSVSSWPALEANTFYTKQGEGGPTGDAAAIKPAPDGAILGLFSVAPDKQVYFSQGNLQYNMNTTAGAVKWRFAPNQFDYIGDANKANGQNTAATEDTWIDLFGWGSTGNNPNPDSEHPVDEYYIYYQPWTIVYSYDWLSEYNRFGYGPSTNRPEAERNLLVSNGSDWGANAISNGGNQPGKWRTLTDGEWDYLFNTRMVNGKTGYGNTCAKATVESVDGLIIFCDDYTGTTQSLTSIPDGCVFLPAAGCLSSTGLYWVGISCCYWSSSYLDNFSAHQLYFYSKIVLSQTDRCDGISVRLVSEN